MFSRRFKDISEWSLPTLRSMREMTLERLSRLETEPRGPARMESYAMEHAELDNELEQIDREIERRGKVPWKLTYPGGGEEGLGRRYRTGVRRAKPGWRRRAPMRTFSRRELRERCGAKAFLDPKNLRYPVMSKRPGKATCMFDCQGILSAYKRAGQQRDYRIQIKAINLGKRSGCRWAERASKRLPELRRKAR